MRGKKAKAIRQLAHALAVTVAEQSKEPLVYDAYFEMTKRRKKSMVENKVTGEMEQVDIALGTIMLDENCEKRIYRKMKRHIKRKMFSPMNKDSRKIDKIAPVM